MLTGKREKFCQLVGSGSTYTDAYLEAYQKPAEYDRKLASEAGSRLMADTDIKLRVQELRRPVIRKFQRKLEYSLNKALEECQVAYDLAYKEGDARGILKAVEMKAKLAKLLGDEINVAQRHGLLDDASTEVLLAMRKEIEIRQAKQKKLLESRMVNSKTDSGPPPCPRFGSISWVPSGAAVASSLGPE